MLNDETREEDVLTTITKGQQSNLSESQVSIKVGLVRAGYV